MISSRCKSSSPSPNRLRSARLPNRLLHVTRCSGPTAIGFLPLDVCGVWLLCVGGIVQFSTGIYGARRWLLISGLWCSITSTAATSPPSRLLIRRCTSGVFRVWCWRSKQPFPGLCVFALLLYPFSVGARFSLLKRLFGFPPALLLAIFVIFQTESSHSSISR